MHPAAAPRRHAPVTSPPERFLLLPGGEPDRGGHPAGEGRRRAAGVPQGHFDATLLLLIGEEEDHGYELSARLGELGFADADMGTLYRRLRRLERDKLVESRWDAALSGPPRRVYSLTEAGAAWLADYVGTALQTRSWLTTFLHRYRAAQPG
jgi:poly-beta-hydroxybutyrate-responsive repressor